MQEVEKADVILQLHFGDRRACNCHALVRDAYQITLLTRNTCGQDQGHTWHIQVELGFNNNFHFP